MGRPTTLWPVWAGPVLRKRSPLRGTRAWCWTPIPAFGAARGLLHTKSPLQERPTVTAMGPGGSPCAFCPSTNSLSASHFLHTWVRLSPSGIWLSKPLGVCPAHGTWPPKPDSGGGQCEAGTALLRGLYLSGPPGHHSSPAPSIVCSTPCWPCPGLRFSGSWPHPRCSRSFGLSTPAAPQPGPTPPAHHGVRPPPGPSPDHVP